MEDAKLAQDFLDSQVLGLGIQGGCPQGGCQGGLLVVVMGC